MCVFRTEEKLYFVVLLIKISSIFIPTYSRACTDAPPGDQQCRLPAADGHDCGAEEREDIGNGNISRTAGAQGGLRRVRPHLSQ